MTGPKESIADALNVSQYDESFAANADRAATKVPVLGDAYKAGKSIAAHAQEMGQADNVGELASGAKDLAADGAKFVSGAAMDVTTFVMDPIGWLVSNGLNILLELVQPLQDALHQVSGDGPAIGHASDNFVTMAQGFVALAEDFEKTGDTALKDWLDEAGDEARKALGEFSTGIRGVGSAAGSVAEVLQMWSMVMVVIEEVIKAIISELISWLITIWLPALATSIISFGGSVAAAMTASIAKAASVLQKVLSYLGKFGKLLSKFIEFLAKFATKAVQFADKLRVGKVVEKGSRGIPLVGKVAERSHFVPSNRVISTTFGTHAGVGPLAKGIGVKSGIGAGKGIGKEGAAEYKEDGPMFNKSGIGGDHSVEDTRGNLDM
ncbi:MULTISPECIES: hypothetical protein [unclassified Crossiella]|uniref:hypothetical protein n=1 Tax=Crossiella sp. SN42 TaxID=2944808 RepID=UPI00207C5119|nr:hypothetical protein [Crossiella sp. SN42]MCO1581884.1 hypothetical protein [Crossiella sp. SN42]